MTKRKSIKPRTQLDLGDFNDNTLITEPSVCDPDQSESIQYLLEKCITGRAKLHFDVGAGMSTSDAVAGLSPTEQDGFDLADAAVVASPIQGGTTTPSPSEKSKEGPVPVDSPTPEPPKPA